jgi:hypothetical protein
MKSPLYILLLLVASLVAASLDAFPDPPAVHSHALDVKVTGARDLPNACDDQRSHWISLCRILPPPFGRVEFAGMLHPNRLGDEKAAMRHAADASPPAVA